MLKGKPRQQRKTDHHAERDYRERDNIPTRGPLLSKKQEQRRAKKRSNDSARRREKQRRKSAHPDSRRGKRPAENYNPQESASPAVSRALHAHHFPNVTDPYSTTSRSGKAFDNPLLWTKRPRPRFAVSFDGLLNLSDLLTTPNLGLYILDNQKVDRDHARGRSRRHR
jgi:hypothetical protein